MSTASSRIVGLDSSAQCELLLHLVRMSVDVTVDRLYCCGMTSGTGQTVRGATAEMDMGWDYSRVVLGWVRLVVTKKFSQETRDYRNNRSVNFTHKART